MKMILLLIKNCNDCPHLTAYCGDMDSVFCRRKGEYIDNTPIDKISLPTWCPLKDVEEYKL